MTFVILELYSDDVSGKGKNLYYGGPRLYRLPQPEKFGLRRGSNRRSGLKFALKLSMPEDILDDIPFTFHFQALATAVVPHAIMFPVITALAILLLHVPNTDSG